MTEASSLVLVSGSGHRELTRRVADELRVELADVEVGEFPDGELRVEVRDSIGGDHAVIVQPTCAPAERNLFELCLLADACRRSGAAHVTAVVPYFGYARHDRRARGGEAIGIRVVTDLLAAARVGRIAAVDVHNPAIEAVSSVPFEHLTAFPQLLPDVRAHLGPNPVVVAPDLGAAKLAQRIGRALDAPVALVHKVRRSGERVEVHALAGDVRGRTPLLIDDMISTGATVEAAARVLLEAGCTPPLLLVAVHGLFVGPAVERLRRLPLARIIVTDSVPTPAAVADALPLERFSLAPMLADAIRAVYSGRSIEPVLLHG